MKAEKENRAEEQEEVVDKNEYKLLPAVIGKKFPVNPQIKERREFGTVIKYREVALSSTFPFPVDYDTDATLLDDALGEKAECWAEIVEGSRTKKTNSQSIIIVIKGKDKLGRIHEVAGTGLTPKAKVALDIRGFLEMKG